MLGLLQSLISRTLTLDGASTTTVVDTLAALAHNLTAAQAESLVGLTDTLMNRTAGVTQDAVNVMLRTFVSGASSKYTSIIFHGFLELKLTRVCPSFSQEPAQMGCKRLCSGSYRA